MGALPYAAFSLISIRKPPGYPNEVKHLGDRLKRRRLALGLLMKEAAALIGTCPETYRDLESGKRQPEVRRYPGIIRFLGENFLAKASTRGEAIRRRRLSLGLSLKGLGKLVGLDGSTIGNLERSGRTHLGRLEFVESMVEKLKG